MMMGKSLVMKRKSLVMMSESLMMMSESLVLLVWEILVAASWGRGLYPLETCEWREHSSRVWSLLVKVICHVNRKCSRHSLWPSLQEQESIVQ